MTLAPEENCFWRDRVSYVFGDLRRTYFRDECFDAVVCLSVLEHIGFDNKRYASGVPVGEQNPAAYLDAIKEFRRILKPGGVCLITVPFGRHHVRDWLQLFDLDMVRMLIVCFAPREHNVSYFVYSEENGWQTSTAERASHAGYFDLNSDKPWPGCPAGAGAIACIELKK
jgi:ubiquinone/menaquinone biosynthesis C-methylase UbiE